MLKNLYSESFEIIRIYGLSVYTGNVSGPLTPFLRLSITKRGYEYE